MEMNVNALTLQRGDTAIDHEMTSISSDDAVDLNNHFIDSTMKDPNDTHIADTRALLSF